MGKNNVSAVVLAAGRSRRMGRDKSLLPLGDRTLLRQVLAALAAAGMDDIYLVLGPNGNPVAESLGEEVAIVWNRADRSDMADSLKAVLPHLPDDGVMVCLGDQPLITPETYRRLAREFRSRPDAVIQPRMNGRKGHPVVLPRRMLREIAFRPTLRDVLAAHPEALKAVDVADPGILFDVDTPDDYRRLLRAWETRRDP